ncbi:glycosyltransferase BC10-like [Humulus lupulus]|uniref:glycosyltransferase BC10-like n=1 Tax=Humulus lupulus TaxID=3486 RepID=UPI002B40604A|nr:glycosyltransferase BC10-like [Humulus lupulus]
MKESKTTVFLNDLSIRIKREANLNNFHIRTTVILSLMMTFFALILGLFIHDRIRSILSSPDDTFFPQLNTHSSLSPNSHFQNDTPSNSDLLSFDLSKRRVIELGDWIAPKELQHSMSDEELFWRASMMPHVVEYPYNRTPKMAFMFLTKGKLPLAPLWERFFKGHQGLYSIYLHTSPDYALEPPESSVFYKRRIPSQGVEWGKKTMVDAERRLLANALLDFSNERFILLSETCIPIFNFTTIYTHLINSNQSFLSLFDDPRRRGRGRYNHKMGPTISLSDWRKGSQWFEAQRRLAVEIVSDSRYYSVFVEHCNPPCYMDEHYLPTLVNKVCPDLTSNESITWVDWSRDGPHPSTFTKRYVSEAFLNRIRHGFNCTYNGRISSICFLFARKFHPNTLQPLLSIAPDLLGFNV